MRNTLFLVTAAILVLACQAHKQDMEPSVTPKSVPEITSETEEHFHDLVFGIATVVRAPDGSQEITATGAHKGEPVRFQAVLASTWKRGQLADRPSFSGVVTVRSVGSESDTLVRVLDTIYRAKLMPKGMASAVSFAAISLKGNPLQLAVGEVALKLFFESENEERYAEVYLNIDVAKSRVELREKDGDYRAPVVRALSLGRQ